MNSFFSILKRPLLSAACAALFLAGCVSNPPAPRTAQTAHPYTTEFQIGQKLTILFDQNGIPGTWEQVVGEDGQILLPLNQSVVAAGKTKAELEQAIRDIYVPRYYHRLTPNIQQEDRWYFVRGEVNNPNQLKYISSMTVLKAIAAAGDFTDFADRSDVMIHRGGETIRVNAKAAIQNPDLDIPIYPGDTIFVGRRL